MFRPATRQAFLGHARGRKAFDPLETRTERQVGAVLDRLAAPEQGRLVAAMGVIERMMAAAPKTDSDIILREPRPGDLGWVVTRHAELYAQEYGWVKTSKAFARDRRRLRQQVRSEMRRGRIAEIDGQNVGCVFLVKIPRTSRGSVCCWSIRSTRGRGLGTRLTTSLRFAREAGYRGVTLWTHKVLTAARHVYEQAGFRLTSSEKRKSFGQDVVSENWDMTL